MKRALEFGNQAARRLFGSLGLSVTFARPFRDPIKLLINKSKDLGVMTVLDVGANVGQFGKEVRRQGYQGELVSFEPLSAAYHKLISTAAQDAKWFIAPRMAIGETRGAVKIHISENLASSSLLKVTKRTIETAPTAGVSGEEEVHVRRLDDVMKPAWRPPYAMKLDTQGFELQVLRGAPETLRQTVLVMIEMSLAPLYEGGSSFVDVFRFLEENGFHCITLTHGFADHKLNELLQVDGIFVRK